MGPVTRTQPVLSQAAASLPRMSDDRQQALRDSQAAWHLARQSPGREQASAGPGSHLDDDALDLLDQLDGDRDRILAASTAICATAADGLPGDPASWDAAIRAVLICLRATELIQPGAAA